MSYKMIHETVERLVIEELADASGKWGRIFASKHEGESVIREEVLEAALDMKSCEDCMEELTTAVFEDMNWLADSMSATLEKRAIRLASEAIQVAAMARKFRITESKAVAKLPRNCATCRNSSVPQICNACHDKKGYAPDQDKLEGLLP